MGAVLGGDTLAERKQLAAASVAAAEIQPRYLTQLVVCAASEWAAQQVQYLALERFVGWLRAPAFALRDFQSWQTRGVADVVELELARAETKSTTRLRSGQNEV